MIALYVYAAAILAGFVPLCIIKACDEQCERRDGFRLLACILNAIQVYLLCLIVLS